MSRKIDLISIRSSSSLSLSLKSCFHDANKENSSSRIAITQENTCCMISLLGALMTRSLILSPLTAKVNSCSLKFVFAAANLGQVDFLFFIIIPISRILVIATPSLFTLNLRNESTRRDDRRIHLDLIAFSYLRMKFPMANETQVTSDKRNSGKSSSRNSR